MRKRKNSAIFLCAAAVLLCLAGMIVYMALFVWPDDTTPPVISMETDELAVSVQDDDAALLAGVTAVDDRDGDVTANILVQGVSNLNGETVTVTYGAFDAAGNVSKATRTLRYTDYEPPRFGQRGPLVFTASIASDVLGQLSAMDVIDGDISSQVKANLVSNTGSLTNPGTHQVEFRVTNSLGDTSYLTLPVDVYAQGSYNAAVVLEDYLVYVPKGGDFSPADYLVGLDVGFVDEIVEDRSVLNVKTQSDVNTNIPGVYSVRYTVTYFRNTVEYVGYTRLNVVVEE